MKTVGLTPIKPGTVNNKEGSARKVFFPFSGPRNGHSRFRPALQDYDGTDLFGDN